MNWPPEQLARYQQMRDIGTSAEDVAVRADKDGLGAVETIKLLIHVFELPFVEAKRLYHEAVYYPEHGITEEQHTRSLIAALEQVKTVLNYEAQIGRHLTEAEAEAFLRGESIQTDL